MALVVPQSISIAIGAASVQGNLVPTQWNQYQLTATAACWVATGMSPTAVAGSNGSMYVPANYPITINASISDMMIAVIEASSAGTLSVTPNE